MNSPADCYLLDRSYALLNNGSVGAVPRVVLEQYLRYQQELETHPTAFYRRAHGLMHEARGAIGRVLPLFNFRPSCSS